jgi:hypothetical protein
MDMEWFYNLKKYLFTFIGDIKWHGWKHPLWIEINAAGYKLKGEHYREIRDLLRPGDIVLRRFNNYLDSYIIPGFFNHAGLYVGDVDDKPEQVIHALSEGIIQEDILNFMRTDDLCILRVKEPHGVWSASVIEAIKRAKSVVGQHYDFSFDFSESKRLSCTELVAMCYPGLVVPKRRYFKEMIIGDDFLNSDKLAIVWNSQDIATHGMSVVESYFSSKCPYKKVVLKD